MSRHRTTGRLAVAVALTSVLALGAAGCSSDDEPAAPTTTTTTSTATGTGGEGPGPTRAELTAILPAPIDLGEGWVEQPAPEASAGDDASPTDLAIEKQCPELAAILDDPEEASEDDQVTRTFVDADGRELEIELDPSARMRSDADLQEAVDATNACDEVVVDDRDGVTTTLRFQAAIDPDHGEQAVKLQADVQITLPAEDEPISLTLYGLVFRTGPVGVRLTAADGLEPESLEVIRTDMELLTTWSDRLEASVDDLVG